MCWQGLKLTEDCQEELLGCYDDLKQTQTSLSVIMKNLNCTYTHQVSRKQQCSDTFTWSSWANLPPAPILKPIGCGTFSGIGGVWFWVSWSLDRIFFLVLWSYHRNNLKVVDFFCLWESDSWNRGWFAFVLWWIFKNYLFLLLWSFMVMNFKHKLPCK